MKKLIALLTAVLMLLSVSGTIYAAPLTSQNDVRLCYNSEFDFTVTERDGANNTTVRTFERESNTPVAAMSLASESTGLSEEKKAETEAILSALGMEDEFIERLSDEALQQYSTSPQIVSTVSYIKTDENGNSVNVTKEEAEEATAGTRGLTLPPHEYDEPTGGTDSYYNYEEDAYMKLVLIVSYLGDARYKFSVDAIWLTFPRESYEDFIGACAMGIAVENASRSGWYIRTYTPSQEIQTFEFEDRATLYNSIEGNWYGSGAKFDRPTEVLSILYSNRKAHYEFIGAIHLPNQACNFNVTATYEYITENVTATVSVGISTTGTEVSIGFVTEIDKESLSVALDTYISYVPD